MPKTDTTILNENMETLRRVRIAPLLTHLLRWEQAQQARADEERTLEKKLMSTTAALIAAATRLQTAAAAKEALDAQTITGDESLITQDQLTLAANAQTITDLQNHEVDDSAVDTFNAAAAIIEATLPPATAPTVVQLPDGTTIGLSLPVPVSVGNVVPVPVAAPDGTSTPTTLDHTITAIDPSALVASVTPVPGAVPVATGTASGA
ncbi:MAG: hypothetical protein ACRYFS_11875 [Janthinobacterium lividum]